MEEYSLSDELIGQVAKLLQVAILTGTDVVDNLRTIKVQINESDSQLVLSDNYRADAEGQVEKMLEFVSTSLEEESSDGPSS